MLGLEDLILPHKIAGKTDKTKTAALAAEDYDPYADDCPDWDDEDWAAWTGAEDWFDAGEVPEAETEAKEVQEEQADGSGVDQEAYLADIAEEALWNYHFARKGKKGKSGKKGKKGQSKQFKGYSGGYKSHTGEQKRGKSGGGSGAGKSSGSGKSYTSPYTSYSGGWGRGGW